MYRIEVINYDGIFMSEINASVLEDALEFFGYECTYRSEGTNIKLYFTEDNTLQANVTVGNK